MAQLSHENEIFLDAFHEDGLLIMARGLGVERVFTSFLKLYSDPGNLVLVLNTSSQEEDHLLDELKARGTDPLPKVITTEYSINDRKDLYLQGGVLFVTSRILVVDMLTDRLPIHLITGILVFKAHKIIDSCQEAFILRLYRQKNKKGFIKAFSDNAQAFTAGFCHVERVMKSLFVRKLFLWPRFHAAVMSSLERHKVDVVEIYVQPTDAMVACQTSLLDLIDACIKELKKANVTLDTEEITVENAITHGFDKIVKLHLEPIWHQLSPTTKQLIADVKTLRLLLEYLTQYDCVNFYNLVSSIRSNERQFATKLGWLFLDSADSLFVHARERVFGNAQKSKKQKTGKSKETKDLTEMEECPKWKALKDVLEEIKEENQHLAEQKAHGPVLIVGQDERTCNQITEYLSTGGKSLLERLYNKTQKIKTGKFDYSAKYKGTKWKDKQKQKDTLTLTQMIDPSDDEEDGKDKTEGDPLENTDTVVKPLRGSDDAYTLQKTLKEIQPRFVVMYDADMSFVRQLEVFRATTPGQPLRCYFLMYTGSSEEQKYLTTLRKEKEAFEYLIREKATMVIPEEREGKLEDDPELSRDITPANKTVNTRKGGTQNIEPSKIIVDMREFRSELPSLIHRRGIDIEPVTIEVGDYILTPDICVERKSVSDLIGSLNNGRLYNQAVSMCRFYRRPILLIEFDPNKAFTLQGKYTLRDDITSSDVMSRLTLLTIHFPRLRVLWCQSPYVTAQLFQEIKDGRPEPSAEQAMAVSAETAEDLTSDKYSHGPQNMLLKMPGINSKNVGIIMNKVSCMSELITLSTEDLTTILQSEANAKRLHSFLHKEPSNITQTAKQSSTSRMLAAAAAKNKFKGKKR